MKHIHKFLKVVIQFTSLQEGKKKLKKYERFYEFPIYEGSLDFTVEHKTPILLKWHYAGKMAHLNFQNSSSKTM